MSAYVVAHPYGAEELKRAAHKYGFTALSISILIHLCIIGSYYLNAMFDADKPLLPPRRGGPIVIYKGPPKISGTYELPAAPHPPIPGRVKDGIPVPVATEPHVLETIPTQGERRDLVDPHGEDLGTGEVEMPTDLVIPEEAPRDTFIAVEREPVLVRSTVPMYPSLALKAGLEGRVLVKMWVDRQGNVRQVKVVKSSSDIFNDAAVEAAKQFVFAPAYMNSGPVSVWVAFPFRFRLTDSK